MMPFVLAISSRNRTSGRYSSWIPPQLFVLGTFPFSQLASLLAFLQLGWPQLMLILAILFKIPDEGTISGMIYPFDLHSLFLPILSAHLFSSLCFTNYLLEDLLFFCELHVLLRKIDHFRECPYCLAVQWSLLLRGYFVLNVALRDYLLYLLFDLLVFGKRLWRFDLHALIGIWVFVEFSHWWLYKLWLINISYR